MDTRRQLAAVMFTDIEDFTSTMQTDEEEAMNLRSSHRKILDAYHLRFNGEVINYMGDGTLSIFTSSRDAVECAIEMQKAFRKKPKVPLRIGIHLGEILRVGDDIAGDAVNIASRIESIAVAGSILISSKVYDDLKNQNWIETVSIGFYEFKNVDKAKEVFAISNEGLIVPDSETITGKLKDTKSKTESEKTFSHLIKELWKRKVFLVLGLYLIVLLIILQAVKSIIDNYPISPYWYELILVFFLSFLPSIIIHTYHHNRIELLKLKIVEKISIPFNLILSATLLILMFYGKDLGATTQTFKTQDEFGNLIEKEIAKDEFKAKIYLFSFKNKTGDSLLNWLQFGISRLIVYDISQDNSVLWTYDRGLYSLGEMINIAKNEYWTYFATGEIQRKEGSYIIKTKLYSSEYGKLLQEREVRGENIFDICDSLSVFLKKDINVPKYYIQNSKDLPIKSIMTSNIKAYEAYIKARSYNNYQDWSGFILADSLDPSFALNNYEYAYNLFNNYLHYKEALIAIKKAMKYRVNVPDYLKMEIETLNFRLNNQNDKAIAYNELRVELNPEFSDGYLRLMTEYYRSGYYEKALKAVQNYYKIEVTDNWAILDQVWLLKILNRNQEALNLIISYVDNYPNDPMGVLWLGDIYLSLGNLKKAEEIFTKASLLEPDNNTIHSILRHIKYLAENGKKDLRYLNQFIGEFRHGSSQYEEEIIVKNGKLFKKDFKRGLSQLYPINDSTFVFIRLFNRYQRLAVCTFSKNNDGKYYKYQFRYDNSVSSPGFYPLLYSINQEIRNAENLLLENQDKAALDSYEIALKNNPGHHFLNEFINHLKFKKTNAYNLLYAELNGFSLNYNNQRITCEDGQLFFWQIGNGLKFKMLPISSEEFIIQEKWLAKIKLIKDDGKITGFELSYSE